MRVLICPCIDKEKSIAAVPSVITALRANGITPLMHESVCSLCSDERAEYADCDGIPDECDMLLTVGGDGMILKWGRLAASAGKPLIGINTGRVGFMTALDVDEPEKLSALADGSYSISRRMMLDVQFNGEHCSALNDVVLYKEANSKLPEFTVSVNGATVTRVRADGLIFSTPTGSTAYALSAGGPIIDPSVECIQLTPLCAHSLFSRPIIFAAGDSITVSYARYERSSVNIGIDGGEDSRMEPETEAVIRRSDIYFDLVQLGSRSFYSTVSEKLMTPLK